MSGADDRTQLVAMLLANREAFLAFLSARVESRATAEDLLQDALARAVERIDELRASDAALGWFYQVLRNTVVDHYRRKASASKTLERLAAEPVEDVLPPEEPRRVCTCVSRLAKELKPEYAEALQRVEIDGTAVKDVADELGISSGNAAVRVFRARDALRKKVVSTCGACAAAGCVDCDCSA